MYAWLTEQGLTKDEYDRLTDDEAARLLDAQYPMELGTAIAGDAATPVSDGPSVDELYELPGFSIATDPDDVEPESDTAIAEIDPSVPLCHWGIHLMTDDNKDASNRCLACVGEYKRRYGKSP